MWYCSRMDATNQLICMEEAGIITDAQLLKFKQIINKLPTSQGDLLSIIAAALLGGSSSLMVTGTPVAVDQYTSSNESDPQPLMYIPDDATSALVSVHGNNIIFRTDGGVPALETGHFAAQGSNFLVNDLANFRFCSTSAVDAVIFVSYY